VRATFIDPVSQAAMARDGFVVVPFLDDAEVELIRSEYARLGPAPGDPQMACISTFHCSDADYKRSIDAVIRSAFDRARTTIFDRQRALPASLLVKWPGDRGGVGLHQDLAHVDESAHDSVGVWVALEDTDGDNGQIWFVPGSHEWLPTLRGIQAFPFPFREVAQRIVEEFAVPVPLRRGEAIVFPQRTLHFSMPNRTDAARLVAIANLIPEEATHIQYFGDGEGDVHAYALNDEFWYVNNPFNLWQPPPAIHRTGEAADFEYRELTHEGLAELVAEGRAVPTGCSPCGPINAPVSWCYRCGGTDGFDSHPDRWIGNVTLLCPSCQAVEAVRAPSAAHVGTTPVGDPIDLAPLHSDGWTTFPLLPAPSVERLRAAFDGAGIDPDTPFHASSAHSPRDVAAAIDAVLKEEVRPYLQALLPDLEVFLGSFIYKAAASGWVSLHQDWTFHDERTTRTFVIWCPLVDVDADGGALHVIPGSHRWTDGVRGSGDIPDLLPDEAPDAWAAAVPVPLRAGHAVMYDAAILHGSTPTGSQPRPVVGLALGPVGAPLLHVHREDGVTTAHAVEPDFFTTQPYGEAPTGYPEVPVPGPITAALPEAALQRLLGVEPAPGRRSWTDRLRRRGAA